MKTPICLILCAVLGLATPAVAQSVYIGTACTLSWAANTESDLKGYEAQASTTATSKPLVTILAPGVSTTCAALGVDADELWTFRVRAMDQAGNRSAFASIQATRDTKAPGVPGGLSVSSPQPIALTITPNALTKTTTLSWVPGQCRGEFVVHRLISGSWREIKRTQQSWIAVPLVNAMNQPYAVSALCP